MLSTGVFLVGACAASEPHAGGQSGPESEALFEPTHDASGVIDGHQGPHLRLPRSGGIAEDALFDPEQDPPATLGSVTDTQPGKDNRGKPASRPSDEP